MAQHCSKLVEEEALNLTVGQLRWSGLKDRENEDRGVSDRDALDKTTSHRGVMAVLGGNGSTRSTERMVSEISEIHERH